MKRVHNKDYHKRYRGAHREKSIAYLKKWRMNNEEKIKKFRKDNREKLLLACRKYRSENLIKERKRVLEYNRTHKEERLAYARPRYALYNNRRRIKKLNAPGRHTFGEWELLRKQYNYTCPCCGEQEPRIWLTEDHIIPLSKGGSDNIENIQPLCSVCNSIKHTQTIKYERPTNG